MEAVAGGVVHQAYLTVVNLVVEICFWITVVDSTFKSDTRF